MNLAPVSLRRRLFLCTVAVLAVFWLGCEEKKADEPAAEKGDKPSTGATPEPGEGEASAEPGAPAGGDEAPAEPDAGDIQTVTLPELTFTVPADWQQRTPSSSMRKAEIVIPAAADGAKETTATVFRFPGGAGTREANIDRWLTQIQPEDGTAAREAATLETTEVNGLTVTTVDVAGRFIAAVRPGAPERYDEPGWRLVGVIVEGSGDPYFIKIVGPAETLAAAQAGIDAMVASMKVP